MLDAAPVPILTLPKVVDAVGKRITVIVDSGFRRGADVLKALALGATCGDAGPRAAARRGRCG